MSQSFVITGTTGFLGEALMEHLRADGAAGSVIGIPSPRFGGPDLASPSAVDWLNASVSLPDPERTVLVHAAAAVDWHSPRGLLENASMAVHLAEWAVARRIGFSVLVSGVNVFPKLPFTPEDTPCHPPSMYGAGKVAAEEAWRLMLDRDRHAVIRLAGIWGWQRKPTLVWNRLLLVAAGLADGAGLQLRPSRRNYVSAPDAARCLRKVALDRAAGTFLAAGRDAVGMDEYVAALQRCKGAELGVEVPTGEADDSLYEASPELEDCLSSFEVALAELWADRHRREGA